MAEKLKVVFGDGGTSLESWLVFQCAYTNARELNELLKDTNAEAKLWSDNKVFRARKVLAQLRGEPLVWLSQEENKKLLEDDKEMLEALHGRYGRTKARAAYISEFEESRQQEGESLDQYLSRLQQLVAVAFPTNDLEARRERVLSRFMRTIQSSRLREELLVFGLFDEQDQQWSYQTVLRKANHLQGH